MLNTVFLMGRLTKAPELRYTNNNTAVCSFSIAVERNYRTGGEKTTDFFNIVAWSNTAEFISKHFTKGRMIVVKGRLQQRNWEKDGVKHNAVDVVAEEVYFGDSKPQESPAHTVLDDYFVPVEDDDVPFYKK